jgi:membrane associated rhomboid family serine protease
MVHRFGHLRQRLGTVTWLWLVLSVALHVVFLVTVNVAHSPVAGALYSDGLALSPAALRDGRIWTLASYALLHDLHSPLHLLFSLLVVWFLGPPAERSLGRARYLRLLLAATVLGGLLQVGWSSWRAPLALTVGPSAAVLALVAHLSWSRPEAEVMLLFALRLQAKYLVWVLIGLDVLMLLSGQHAALWADLGGLAAAWFFVVAGGSPRVAWVRLGHRWRRAKGPKLTVVAGGAQHQRQDSGRRQDRGRREDWN